MMAVVTASRKSVGRSSSRRRITPEDLLRLHFICDPQISPDGGTIVFVKKHVGDKNEYVSNLWLVAASGGEPRQFTSSGKDSAPRWSPAGDRIAFVSGRDKPKPQVYTISAGGGEAVALTAFPEGWIGSFKWSPDGKLIAVSFREQDPQWTDEAKKKRKDDGSSDPPRVLDDIWYRLDGDGYFNAQRYHLYLVDVASGNHRKVYTRDALGFFSFDFSPDSKRLVIGTNRDHRALMKDWNDDLLLLEVGTGKLKAIPNLPRGPKDSVCFSPRGDLVAYAGREGGDDVYGTENLELWVCDPVKGRARSLTGGEDYCLLAIALSDVADVVFGPTFRWSPDGGRLYVQLGWHGESHIASVGTGGDRVIFLTSGPIMHQMGNLSTDGKRMALWTSHAAAPDEVAVGEVAPRSIAVRVLTSFNKSLLGERDVAKIQSHWVKAADGTRVQLWVMRPPGFKPGRRYPSVLQIHGGPHAQYGVGFFHEFQVLAAAGYVVFFSNPRGSKGYGRDHCAAIRGSWGGADWQDIQAVIEFAKSRPYVNSARLGIMGGSYGGYMTNWAIGHCHDFAAAITDRCVSNLLSMAGSSDFPDRPDHYWPGNPWDRAETRWAQSPIRYFNKVKTPTLVIHSEGDLRCNIEQAEQVFTSLMVRGVPTRFVRYPRSTSHGLSRGGPPDTRLHRLQQILGWWKEYL